MRCLVSSPHSISSRDTPQGLLYEDWPYDFQFDYLYWVSTAAGVETTRARHVDTQLPTAQPACSSCARCGVKGDDTAESLKARVQALEGEALCAGLEKMRDEIRASANGNGVAPMETEAPITYAAAGVSIDAGNALVEQVLLLCSLLLRRLRRWRGVRCCCDGWCARADQAARRRHAPRGRDGLDRWLWRPLRPRRRRVIPDPHALPRTRRIHDRRRPY